METKINRSPRADSVDEQAFRDMLASPSWARYVERVQNELERARLACERAVDGREIRKAQGAAVAWRAALALPAAILAELKPKPHQAAAQPQR